MKTTQEIYEAMLEGIRSRSGFAADDSCDLAVRLYAAAAQIESLYAYADWSRRQCFPQTATGEYLDLHAQIHSVTRDPATCAVGSLTVGMEEALDFEVVIPAGTRFCVPDGLHFCLTKPCRIQPGSRSAQAAAECTVPGIGGNAAAGEITGMVDAPVYISFVTNPSPFSGGKEAESDEHLRLRVLKACAVMPNGANAAYYEALAMAQPGITSAAAIPAYLGDGTLALYISGDYGIASEEQIAQVRRALADRTEMGITVALISPLIQPVDVTITVWPVDGVSGAKAVAAARAAIEESFSGPILRQGFYRSRAGSLIYNTGLVKNYDFIQPTKDSPPTPTALYTLGNLLVQEGV